MIIIIMNNQQQQMNEANNVDEKQTLTQKSKDQLIQKIKYLMQQNKKLKSRLEDYEPHKTKKLRQPNQQKIVQLFKTFKTKKYALKICYIGTTYDGMAYQQATDNNTIQAYILKSMHAMSLIKGFNLQDTQYTRAGRTDKGVSAMGNVISLRLRSNERIDPEDKIQKNTKKIQYCSMLNAILPDDIRILACEEVSDEFNARYWCTRRSYKYFFPKNTLNIKLMEEAIKYFIGTHNFLNFCKINLTNTVNFQRTIFHAQIIKSDVDQIFQDDRNQIYYFYFVGNSFLWHQIRFMSSILFLVGSGKEEPEIVKNLLDLNKYPKKPNYPMAPDYALILEDCQYDQVTFQPDLKIITSFYNTFNQMVMKKSTQKTLMINCMMMAQKDILSSLKLSKQFFVNQTINQKKKTQNKGRKSIQLLKSSGRGLDEAISSLKGKKLEIYEKKMQKQEEYETKKRQEILQKQKLKEQKIQKKQF